MKKQIFTSVLFAALGTGLLAGCSTATRTVAPLAADTATSVVSGISLLSDSSFASSSDDSSSEIPTSLSSESSSSEDSSSETPISSDTDSSETPVSTVDLDKYLGIMEQLLSDSPIKMVAETSDREGYAYKLTVTTTDLSGTVSTFVLYYNEVASDTNGTSSSEPVSSETTTESSSAEVASSDTTLVSSESSSAYTMMGGATKKAPARGNDSEEDTEEDVAWQENYDKNGYGNVSDEDRHGYEHFHGDHEVGEVDEETGDMINLTGTVVVNGTEYELVGHKNDTETSFFVSIDEHNWIKVSQDVSDGSSAYRYMICSDGVFTKVAFRITIDDSGTRVTLRQTIDHLTYSYKFYKTTDNEGNEVIFIIANENGVTTHLVVFATVDPTSGDTTYTYTEFETGQTHEGHGHHGYHGDESDEDGRGGHGGRGGRD